eukprot:1670354-Heterocapsa_arctica.AAC.1
MLEIEVQTDQQSPSKRKLSQEEHTVDMEVMVLHTELSQGSICIEAKIGGGDITNKGLKGDCRNAH